MSGPGNEDLLRFSDSGRAGVVSSAALSASVGRLFAAIAVWLAIVCVMAIVG